MSENPAASDWSAERGERWRRHLAGMEAMLAPINEPLLAALQLDGPATIADVGCGGGGTSFELLRRAPASSTVHGFDIAPGLIAAARERMQTADGAIAFDVADVARARPAQTFTRLVSRFGIMFFDDPPAAFANLLRWLAPGGRFAFAAWGRPADNVWMSSVREVVARVVTLPPADPEAPGPFRYGDPEPLVELLGRAGAGALEVRDWRGLLPIGGGLGAAEAAGFALASLGMFAELLAEAGDAAFDEARRLLTERFARDERDGRVQLEACVHVFTGARA